MSDYTEVTEQGCLSRLGGALFGTLFGVGFMIAAVVLIWWNEGRAVKTAKGLTEGAGLVQSIQPTPIDKGMEGKLVHLSAAVETDDVLKDPQFNVETNGLHLQRTVEMYQWKEKKESKSKDNLGGSKTTETTYSYSLTWSSSLINSDNFKRADEYRNPKAMPYESYEKSVSKATFGAFTLSSSVLNQMKNYQDLNIESAVNLENINTNGLSKSVSGNMIYIGKSNIASPELGDIRISFRYTPTDTYSIIAAQSNNSFTPFRTSTGTNIEVVRKGTHTAEALFQSEQESNTMMTWILRVVGYALMFGGLAMLFKPLVILANVVPFIGSIVNGGVTIFAALLSFVGSFTVMSIAWIFYRPILGGILLALAIGALVLFIKSRKNQA
ncbi:MAG: TMEM43 family protein [Bernardetiaceae bacterium]|nr:TMEM43 family protein [Bernardetiaceae bacterium]